MNTYHGASICLNGHVVSKYDANAQSFCSKCGSKVISTCPHCKKNIHGLVALDYAYIGKRPYTRPDYCHNCGNPYPWTEQILNSAVELLALDDELDEQTKELIRTAIPDLLVDTPATPLATAKYQKGISKAGTVLKNSFYQLLIDVVSETVKKTLFP